MRRVWEGVRTHGLRVTLRHFQRRAGIRITPFYWVKELLPADIPAQLTVLPEGFEFGVFGAEEIAIIARFPEGGGIASEQLVLERFRDGHTCLGMKREGQIVAFSWFALDATHNKVHPAVMHPNEAYLFNMYVLPELRGHNLASILRYKNYEILRAMGRDTCYSVTLTSNKASWRFKQKLNAQRVFLGLYIALFGKLEGRWILRRY